VLGLVIGLALRLGMGLILSFQVFQSVLSGTILHSALQLCVNSWGPLKFTRPGNNYGIGFRVRLMVSLVLGV